MRYDVVLVYVLDDLRENAVFTWLPKIRTGTSFSQT